MITFINCCIDWARAALEASYAEAEMHGVEPEKEEAMRIANIYATSGAFNHRYMIRHQL